MILITEVRSYLPLFWTIVSNSYLALQLIVAHHASIRVLQIYPTSQSSTSASFGQSHDENNNSAMLPPPSLLGRGVSSLSFQKSMSLSVLNYTRSMLPDTRLVPNYHLNSALQLVNPRLQSIRHQFLFSILFGRFSQRTLLFTKPVCQDAGIRLIFASHLAVAYNHIWSTYLGFLSPPESLVLWLSLYFAHLIEDITSPYIHLKTHKHIRGPRGCKSMSSRPKNSLPPTNSAFVWLGCLDRTPLSTK